VSERRRLIVNADDFGRAPGVSRGIAQAHCAGIVTSTTMMVNLPSSPEAAGLSGSLPRLGVGLHFNYCYGPPVATHVPSLLGLDGLFDRDLNRLRDRATAADIERETRAQIAHFQEMMGRLPTHLDSHQHIHTWPKVQEVVVSIAAELRLPVRSVTPEQRATLHARGIRTTDAFIGDFFAPGSMTLDGLLAALRSLPPGLTELMCHPGYDDPALADSTFRTQREDEVTYLTSDDVRQAIDDEGIELVTYGVTGNG
jgi:predicted glycoside hydrolase/deacetylase ChbG (UPF0249 family)